MEVLIALAVSLAAGLMATRVFKALGMNFPDVTAFLLAGMVIGPYGIGRLGISGLGFSSYEAVETLGVINTAALGFIAFSIGSEFSLSSMRQIGKPALVIGIFQALAATVLVDAALLVLRLLIGDQFLSVPVCITLGAIASATAPAATLMVVRQYKAHGPVTNLLLPIVALDDAAGLIIFAISMGIALALQGGGLSIYSIAVNPLIEIAASIVLGLVLGLVMAEVEKLFFSGSNRLAMTIAFVLLAIAFSSYSFKIGPIEIAFSSLLVCMMTGTVFCNCSKFSGDIFDRCEKWTVPLYTVFFVLSGAELQLGVFTRGQMILIGVVYILARCAGKYFGARESARAMHGEPHVVKYLGITLFPQAGVALGMVRLAQALGGAEADSIRNVVLFSVMIYELIGPSLTRMALQKAGEIVPTPAQKRSRKRFASG